MNTKNIIAVMLTSVMAITSAMIYPGNTSAATIITVSPYASTQINDGIFEGWGTSLCWWANRIGYSDSLSEQAAELFFGESGLRMNIARYNIGGGDDPSHNHITRTDSDMPGYTVYQNGNITYDWSADSRQRNVLFKAIDACKTDLIVEMFSNSPPYYITKSGCTSGGTDSSVNNLKDDCYDDFAEYIACVCEHFEKTWGINVQSIDPMNEPYTNYWSAYSKKQEGCHFDTGKSESDMIIEMQSAMKRHGLEDSILSGTDETGIDVQISAYKALSSAAKNAISRIDTHTYGGSKRTELQQLALSDSKNLWMSEVDGSGTAGTDAGQMSAALWLSERMITDCRGLGCSAWVLWQAIDNHICSSGYNGKIDSGMPDTEKGYWGLAVADHDNNKIILTKKYYAFGQFSRYIRPGSKILASSDNTMTALDEKNDRLVIVAVNTSGNSKDINVDLSQFSQIGDAVSVVRTSGNMLDGENWKEISPIKTDKDGFNSSLLANSVTTYIIDDVEYKDISANEISISPDMVTGSSPWKNSENVCTKAVDGDLSTFFDGVGDGWIEINLKKGYFLDAIAYAPRSGYEYRSMDSMFMVSSDGQNWEKVYTVPDKPSSGFHYITSLPERKIQYIRYCVPSGKPQNSVNKDDVYCCNIAEIKIYGDENISLQGDVNGDMFLSAEDITTLSSYMFGILNLSETQEKCADINNDGKINIIDFCLIKNMLVLI